MTSFIKNTKQVAAVLIAKGHIAAATNSITMPEILYTS